MPSNPGQPTKYKEEYCQEMIDFFDVECVTYGPRDKKINKFPTFERFALKIGVHHQTLLNWRDANPQFFEAYIKCKEIQKDLLIEGGLSGHYNAAFTMFLAKNVTDLRDKQEVEHSVSRIEIDKIDEQL